MINANYHTHTHRCGHAVGSDEEYVIEALGMGFTELGFSDHIMLPGFSEPRVRGDFSLAQDYYDSIAALKNKYSERMKIYVGYEAESFPLYFPYYHSLLMTGRIDYLILGNHCKMNEKRELIEHFSKIHSASELYDYRDLALSALNSGMFSCFVHPDYFMSSVENVDRDVKKVMRDLISVCIERDIPLEVNTAGIRNGKKKIGDEYRWIYPTDAFFSLAGKMGAKCIFGIDAHAPKQLSDEDSLEQAVLFARKHNLIILDKLPFRKFA